MKTIYYILFFFNSMIVFSQINSIEQKKISNEDFINQIYLDYIPSDYKYYYLQKEAYPINNDILNDIESIHKENEVIGLYDLREKISDLLNTKYEWKINAIAKAKVCNSDSLKVSPRELNPITYFFVDSIVTHNNRIVKSKIFLVTVKKRWSLKKKIKAGDLQWKVYKDNYRFENNMCFTFSIPIFFNNEKNALIIFEDKSQTIYRIYSKKKDTWKKESDILKIYKH